jgi:hypothetical protein
VHGRVTRMTITDGRHPARSSANQARARPTRQHCGNRAREDAKIGGERPVAHVQRVQVRSSHLMRLRPETCQRPEAGRTARRDLCCHALRAATSKGRNGRVEEAHLATQHVPGWGAFSASIARSMPSASRSSASGSVRIVRNLQISNGLPFRPTRRWWKTIDRPSSRAIVSAMTRNTGLRRRTITPATPAKRPLGDPLARRRPSSADREGRNATERVRRGFVRHELVDRGTTSPASLFAPYVWSSGSTVASSSASHATSTRSTSPLRAPRELLHVREHG